VPERWQGAMSVQRKRRREQDIPPRGGAATHQFQLAGAQGGGAAGGLVATCRAVCMGQ
jgi:hypothetical protein